MKKVKILIVAILAFCTCFFIISKNKEVEAATSDGEIVHAYYRSQVRYIATPNTFTITFKRDPLVTDEIAAQEVLLSTYAGSSSSSEVGYISIQLTAEGYVRFNWNNGQVTTIFDVKDFRTGEWEHIAIVRDTISKSFKLYEEGVLLQEKGTSVGKDITGRYAPAIGNDLRPTGDRFPFKGEITDIGVYNTALSVDELLVEYDIEDKRTITKESNPNIQFNWVLEGESSKLVYSETMPKWVKDYSGNGNDAYLCTVFHWYDAPDNEWYKASEDEFTFVFYPDIQDTVDYQKDLIYMQNQWVADHADDMNLKAVLTLGDLTNASFSHWSVTRDAFKIFDNAEIPYIPLLGNHDYDDQTLTSAGGRDTGHFNEIFEYEDFINKEWFVGSKEPNKLDNAYYTFNGGGVDYLIFALEFGPSDSTLDWVSSIIDKPEYADYRVIILSHNIVGRSGYFTDDNNGASTYGFANYPGVDVNNGDEMWDILLSKHDNIIMAAGGHVTGDTIMKRVDTGDNGNKVLSMLIDGQAVRDTEGVRGATLILVCKINEKTKKMTFNYYNPVDDLYFCVENQFEYDFSDIESKNITASNGVNVCNFAKPGEIVNFSINVDDDATDYAVVAHDKKGNKVDVTNNNGQYSVVMPDISLIIDLIQINKHEIKLPDVIELDSKATADLSSYLPTGYEYEFEHSDVIDVSNNIIFPNKAGTTKLKVGVKGLGELVEINVKVNEHICHFDHELIDEKYLANGASCTHEEAYYKSCSCGEAGTNTFVVGNKLQHSFTEKVVDEKYLVSDATCTQQAKYLYSCACGEAGNITFEHGSLAGHTYSNNISCLEKECLECHTHQEKTFHNWGSSEVVLAATSNAEGKKVYTCSDCGATMTEVIPQIPEEKGCFGSIYATLFGVVVLLAITVFVSYKKKHFN